MSGDDQPVKKKAPPKDGVKPEDEEPDIDALMADIRVDIERIYKYLEGLEGKTVALDAKTSIDILHDVELKLNDYMRLIRYVHDSGKEFHVKVEVLVGARRQAKQAEVREKMNEEDRKKNAAAQAKLIANEKKRVKKFGKPVTARSDKPKIKQKKVKTVVDEDTLDQRLYLGLELKDVQEANAREESS